MTVTISTEDKKWRKRLKKEGGVYYLSPLKDSLYECIKDEVVIELDAPLIWPRLIRIQGDLSSTRLLTARGLYVEGAISMPQAALESMTDIEADRGINAKGIACLGMLRLTGWGNSEISTMVQAGKIHTDHSGSFKATTISVGYGGIDASSMDVQANMLSVSGDATFRKLETVTQISVLGDLTAKEIQASLAVGGTNGLTVGGGINCSGTLTVGQGDLVVGTHGHPKTKEGEDTPPVVKCGALSVPNGRIVALGHSEEGGVIESSSVKGKFDITLGQLRVLEKQNA